jgi:hypothetical protein
MYKERTFQGSIFSKTCYKGVYVYCRVASHATLDCRKLRIAIAAGDTKESKTLHEAVGALSASKSFYIMANFSKSLSRGADHRRMGGRSTYFGGP